MVSEEVMASAVVGIVLALLVEGPTDENLSVQCMPIWSFYRWA